MSKEPEAGEKFSKDYFAGYRQGKIDAERLRAYDMKFANFFQRDLDASRTWAAQLGAEDGPEDPDFTDIAPAPTGRMSAEKPINMLRIERQKNGGWLVDGGGFHDARAVSDVSGAFTSTADMLAALTDLLERDDVKREEEGQGEQADG